MYELNFLPLAKDDLCEIAHYISHELSNPAAAAKLSEELIDVAESLRRFPYSGQAYFPIRPLHRNYRRVLVKNYFIFYYINEEKHLITIARVIYARRSALEKALENKIIAGMYEPFEDLIPADEVEW